MPTPKSKPSRMKKPRNSTAMMPNHNSWSPTVCSFPAQQVSIRKGKRRYFGIFRRPRRSRLRVVFLRSLYDVALEQPEPDDREHRVDQGEGHQGGNHHAGGVARDALADSESDQLVAGRIGDHNPWLTAHFGEDPPGAVGQERHGNGQQREPGKPPLIGAPA